jgi:hypothetical protein
MSARYILTPKIAYNYLIEAEKMNPGPLDRPFNLCREGRQKYCRKTAWT